MGPIIFDIAGLELTTEDREILQHPLIGGMILFSRNFKNISQLTALIKDIRESSRERLLLAVDHEGGRVQRFHEGFTVIPAAQSFAMVLDESETQKAAAMAGWLIATELTSVDIDISFAPVLDLGHVCPAIGDRAFHRDPKIVFNMAHAMIDGFHQGGMKVTGKHFPGHGAVTIDSHKAITTDARSCSEIENDMAVFKQLIELHKLDAIMPAHVIYSAFDEQPASGSVFWLKTVLKDRLGFKGVIFSDDLSMEGASVLGDCTERVLTSLNAGCDMALICNNRSGVIRAIDLLPQIQTDKPRSLFHKNNIDYNSLLKTLYWQQCNKKMQRLNELWEMKKSSASA